MYLRVHPRVRFVVGVLALKRAGVVSTFRTVYSARLQCLQCKIVKNILVYDQQHLFLNLFKEVSTSMLNKNMDKTNEKNMF